MLADVEEALGDVAASDAAMERAIASSAPGSDIRSETRAWMVTAGVARGDRELVFRHAAALAEEGGRPLDVEVALGALANTIADDDWNGDGRKDARSGVSRPAVARWLARDPSSGVMVLSEAIAILIRAGRCAEARRVRGRLARLSRGADAARAFAADVRGCVGR